MVGSTISGQLSLSFIRKLAEQARKFLWSLGFRLCLEVPELVSLNNGPGSQRNPSLPQLLLVGLLSRQQRSQLGHCSSV